MNDLDREKAVHAGHCCVSHGCKYGEEDCPVEHGKVKQYHPCEECENMREETTHSYGAHPTHCCSRHGCKYSYKGTPCPVVTGEAQQEYPCQQCVDVKEAEAEIVELQAEIAFVKKLKEEAKKVQERKDSRKKYRLKNTVRSQRVLEELVAKHKDDPKHACDQCGGVFFIADENTDSPFANDRAYAINGVNTVKFQSDPFRSEIRRDDREEWICKECYRNSANEI